jgi:hypothetical protein
MELGHIDWEAAMWLRSVITEQRLIARLAQFLCAFTTEILGCEFFQWLP